MTARMKRWLLAVVIVATPVCGGQKDPHRQPGPRQTRPDQGTSGRLDASQPPTEHGRRPMAKAPSDPPGPRPRVVTIISPEGTRRETWASPGDEVAIDRELPFLYQHRGGPVVRWSRAGDLLRVNGEVAAVDLSAVPVSQIGATAMAAKKAGARCAFWQGATGFTAAQVRALADQPIDCLGFQFAARERNVRHLAADQVLPSLVPLAKRIRMLDGAFQKPGIVLMRQFQALRALSIRQQGAADPMTLETASALWETVAALKQLRHLRVGGEVAEGSLAAGVRSLGRLRRLEMPEVDVGTALADLVRSPHLVGLRATLRKVTGQTGQTGQATSTTLRELSVRLSVPLESLKGLSNLRILRTDDAVPAAQLRAFSKLVVLETGGLSSSMQLPALPALRVLRLRRMHPSASVGIGPLPMGRLPALRHLELTDADLRGNRVEPLASSKELEIVVCNDCQLDQESLLRLSRIEGLRALRFRCSDCPKDARTLQALAQPTPGSRFRTSRDGDVAPKRVPLTVAAAQALRRHGRLRALEIPFAVVADGAVAELWHLTDLTSLNLDYCPIADADLRHLSRLRKLRRLSLRATPLSTAGVAHLASLADLRRVDLSATAIDDGALETVPQWKHLRWLSLEATLLSGKGLGALRSLTALRELTLAHATVTPGAIAREGLPTRLEFLDVSAIHLTPADAVTISTLPRLSSLWGIDSNIEAAALRSLARASRLRTLVIPLNPIRDSDMSLLSRLSHLTRLDAQSLSSRPAQP